MTIAVAVRTSSAVVFASDSKLTATGLAGMNPDGSPIWVTQTYDNATKVVHDVTARLMALTVGAVNVGNTTATDFIESYDFSTDIAAGEDVAIDYLIENMNARKTEHWSRTKAPAADWPGPTLLLATPSPNAGVPRIWKAQLSGETSSHAEILTTPGVWLEGSCGDAIALLYGINGDVLENLGPEIGVSKTALIEGVGKLLAPVNKINLHVMPLQDAIDLAVFLANVQIEMDRFLPGVPACGGPIDVMALRMVPSPEILVYPGKTLHHPKVAG